MHVDLSSVTATLIADELITHHNPSLQYYNLQFAILHLTTLNQW